MIGMPEVVVGIDISVQPEEVWAAITDWERQGEWILATTVRQTSTTPVRPGTEIEAVTGIGRFGVRDTMRITEWDPPWRCTMQHTGRVIRGLGVFEVSARPGGSRFTWTEDLDLPFGALGRGAWPLVKPLARFGLQHSIERFAAFAESYPAAGGA